MGTHLSCENLKRALSALGLIFASLACTSPLRQAPQPEPASDAGADDDPAEEAGCDACAPEVVEGECADDAECAPGQICQEARCLPGCRFDGACAAGQICEGSSCVEGCRDPADCAVGQTCQGGACRAVECADDAECGGGHQCRAGACAEVGAAACDSDEDCGHRWRCTSLGVCHDSVCATHADCASSQWCRRGLCVERHEELGDVLFERQFPEWLRDHRTFEGRTYGVGGGLFDLDGDLDLDVFLGAWEPETDSPPCVYRNVSTPGSLRFEPVEALCGFWMGKAVMAGGVDLEGDGRDELLLLGQGVIRLIRFHPQPEMIDLAALIPTTDLRHYCMAGSYAPTDLDLDGRVDLLVGCQSHKQPRRIEQRNVAFRQREDGGFEVFSGPEYEPLDDDGVTLALGVIDVDQDGQLDLVVANDTFVVNGGQTNSLTTGGLLFRCDPARECAFEAHRFAEGSRAWGSFMGVGNVEIGGQGELLYITDWGANRALAWEGRAARDRAAELGIGLAAELEMPLFAWSALVDDFDRNGLDDIFVSQGSAAKDDPTTYGRHRDALLLQRAEGDFVERGEQSGFGPPDVRDSLNPERPFSSRGAVKADLDRDGLLEILIASLEGHIKVYSEQPGRDNAADRCALAPRPRVVPAYGHGFAVASALEPGRWRRRDVQGHMRFGGSPFIMTTAGRGVLRFPSGAQVAFDCEGQAGPVVIEEPDWVQVEREGGAAIIALEAPWASGAEVSVAIRRASEGPRRRALASPLGQGRWSVTLEGDEDRVMIGVDGRWIARWFSL